MLRKWTEGAHLSASVASWLCRLAMVLASAAALAMDLPLAASCSLHSSVKVSWGAQGGSRWVPGGARKVYSGGAHVQP